MPTINQLSAINTLSGSDQIAVYSSGNGDARKASMSTVLAYVESAFADPNFVKQYASPNVNGTNVQVASTTQSTWLIVTPTGPFAAMTITLPSAASVADGTELLVVCSQAVGALTVSLNGATAVNGAPSALSFNSSFMLRFEATSSSWYAVQSTAQPLTSGTWTPVATLAAPAVNTTFAGRYTAAGNMVTVEFQINVGVGGSITYTTATDFFTGLPLTVSPPSQQQIVSSTEQTGVPTDPRLALGYVFGTWIFVLVGGAPSFTINTPGSYRWTITYLV